jgi:hypothetical protein
MEPFGPWNSLRLRAGLWHPLVSAIPCLLAAQSPWGFWLLFLGPLAGFGATLAMVFARPLRPSERFSLVMIGLGGSFAAFFFAAVGWVLMAEAACDGGYECPF